MLCEKSVLIAAQEHLGFETLRFFLDSQSRFKVIDYATTAKELIEIGLIEKPDLILMCYSFATLNGPSFIHQVREIFANSAIVILSSSPRSREEISMLYQNGVAGFLCTTTCNLKTLFDALMVIDQKSYFFPPNFLPGHIQNQAPSSSSPTHNAMIVLGDREEQVLKMIANGCGAKKIAKQLNISINTVNVHRRNIMKKLNLHKSVELTKYAIKNGLIRL
jgi:DNA-binding NarL/FixJ family response regulator